MAKSVTIFGGSGFLGRYIVNTLAQAGYRVQIASRLPESGARSKLAGSVGQVSLIHANIRDGDSVQRAVTGSDIVINLVGILYPKGRQSFDEIHARGAERIAQSCAKAGVEQFIQLSALGVDQPSGSRYARSKLNGEKAVKAAFPNTTTLRPSIVFGEEDGFFNRFGVMACVLPVLPLIGGGRTLFQPVYVGDVARAVLAIVEQTALQGKTYELGGPKTYSFKQLLQFILNETDRRNLLVPLPFAIAKLEAFFLQLLPKPPLTVDQVRLLTVDNIVRDTAHTLSTLGIEATPIEAVVPTYLQRYRSQ